MKIVTNAKKLYIWSFFLAIIALAVSTYLIYIHFKPLEAGSFCDINAYWNCDRINQSIFAGFLGIPIAVLGFLFYFFLSFNLLGIIKNFNYRLYYPLNSSWLLLLITLFGLTELGIITYLEFSVYQFSSVYQIILILINILFGLLFLWLLLKSKYYSESEKFLTYLISLSLFGFVFAFYLTGIELFVLEGICIFCLIQQILILLILIFQFIAQYKYNRQKT